MLIIYDLRALGLGVALLGLSIFFLILFLQKEPSRFVKSFLWILRPVGGYYRDKLFVAIFLFPIFTILALIRAFSPDSAGPGHAIYQVDLGGKNLILGLLMAAVIVATGLVFYLVKSKKPAKP